MIKHKWVSLRMLNFLRHKCGAELPNNEWSFRIPQHTIPWIKENLIVCKKILDK